VASQEQQLPGPAIAARALIKKLVLIGTLLDFWPIQPRRRQTKWKGSSARRCVPANFQRAMHLFVAMIVTDADTGSLVEQFTRNLLRLLRDTILRTWAPDPDVDITPVLAQVKTPTRVSHGTQDSRVPLSTAHYLDENLSDAIASLRRGGPPFRSSSTTAEFCDVVRRFVRTAEIGPTGHRSG
jgi:pimeloyl-ACP methyl ester carboxylesterase